MKYALTEPQRNIYDIVKLYPDSPISFIAGEGVISDIEFDYEMLNICLNNLVKRNDAYRTKIVSDENGVYQEFKEFKFKNMDFLDFSDKTEEEALNYLESIAKEKFNGDDLVEFKIVKYGEKKFSIYWKISHLIGDAYSAALSCSQFAGYIDDYLNNREFDNEDLPSYSLLLDREKKYYEGARYQKDKEYFKETYKDEVKYNSLALNQTNSIKANRYQRTFGAETIKNFCVEENISEAVFFEAVILMYLRSVAEEDKVTIGSPVLNRSNSVERKTLGMYISTNPFSVDIKMDNTFLEIVKEIKTKKMDLFRRQNYPFANLQEDVKESTGYTGKLFDIVVSYQNAKLNKENDNVKFETKWYFNGDIGNELIFNIDDRDNSGFRLNADYKTELFTEDQIKNIVDRFSLIMNQVMENPNIKLQDINVLDKQDCGLYRELNASADIQNSKSYIENFEDEVEKHPNSLALQFEDKVYTYNEINKAANKLANKLLSENLDNIDIIPVVGNRNYYTIITILALRKINKPYFLLDDSLYKEDKITEMIDRLKTDKILSYGSLYKNNNYKKIDVRNVESSYSENNLNIKTNKEDTFCIIHTSGSTGVPKFVQIADEGVVNMACNNGYLVDGSDSFINLVNMSFDAFLKSTLIPLSHGKKLILTNNEEIININRINDIVAKESKCATILTPSRMKQFVDKENRSFKNINNVILGGEHISEELIKLINEKCDNPNIYNCYGPTETTVFNTVHKIVSNESPIGKAISNFNIYILNKNGKVMPPYTLGEIVVIGDGVAKGYYNNIEETNNSFFRDKITNKRGYKTGDYGYLNNNGDLVFVGRKDNQIKINGLRIEIDEIESHLNKIKNVNLSAVTIQNEGKNKTLVAYLDTKENIDENEIRNMLSKVLPIYMIPNIYVKLDEIPQTSSGKINRNILPKVDITKIIEDTFVAPVNNLESKVCSIWENLFKKDRIGTNTTFYALGGTSKIFIDFISYLEKLEEAKGHNYNPGQFPDNPTVKDICDVMTGVKDSVDVDLNDYKINDNELINNNNENVLITGANGYLGSHFVDYYLKNTNAKIYCLVRDKEKFNTAMKYYFTDDFDFNNSRIKLIIGDISKENLGLSDTDLNEVKDEVGQIVNCAANVSHFSSVKEAKTVNVDGVYNVCKLASEIGASVEHLSTITVSGINVSNQKIDGITFSEDSLDIGQDYTHDAYLLTKYRAEQIVRKFYDSGLKCSTYRTGYIASRSYDNKFQINEDTSAFQMIVNSIIKFGLVPESAKNVQVQSAAVDKIAEAIVKLSKTDNRLNTYHIFDPNVTNLVDYLDSNNIKYKMLSDEEFMIIADRLLSSDQNEGKIVYSYLKGFINNITTNKIDNTKTNDILVKTGFSFR